MSRGPIMLILLLLVVLAVIYGLSAVNTAVPPQPVEKPLTNEALAQ
jgi:Na+-transporting methylmalonyl-CoA/oxaloacetate decarboxylase gamma subunit